ncbi:MAG TPA: glycosyltransferase family 39 protein [Streptosporangiaceae bacterium]|nr:glycosyltransferase family 39 protein [Streptosporangiaceae bacterium]
MKGVRLKNAQPAAAAAGPAEPGAGGAPGVRPASRWSAAWIVAVIPAVAELLVGGYRIGVPSLWRDEAATISGSQRSLQAILTMARHEDAVHAPYYVLMHPVIAAGGTSATALRLPSLIAMTVAVGLTAALARRLALASGLPAAAPIGLVAGLALTAVPLTTRYAQEARPYALAALCAVAASYAFVRALDSPQRRWWVLYTAALLLAGLFDLFAVLIAVAHVISLIWLGNAQRAVVRRWLAACVIAGALLVPLFVLSAGQSGQLNWVGQPGLGTLVALVRDFAGTAAAIPVVAALALLGCVAGLGDPAGPRRPALTAIALPWLVVPPALLIAVSFIHPYYVERYVLFCLPALAVLVAAGLVWLVRLTRRALAGRGLRPRMADVLAVIPSAVLALLLVTALAGPQREIRQVSARPDNLRAVAAVIAGHERADDAVLYLPRETSFAAVAYPAAYRHLRDIGLGRSALASRTLRGTEAEPRLVASRLARVRRLWTLQLANPLSRSTAAPSQLTRLLSGLRLVRRWRIGSIVLRLYAAPSR